jgi:carboxymethylenebutenolidase
MIKRGAFVGLAAGVAVGASMTDAAGQVERVAENDPAITVTTVELRRPDGVVSAYSAQPLQTRADTAGIVVVMHLWGVDASIREVVRGFAKAGFATISPDLYARLGAPSGDGVEDHTIFVPYAQKLQNAQVDGDLRAAALWLQSAHPRGKVGVMGFCMGGAIALRQAIDNSDVFAADAVWYGKVAGIDPARIRMPLMGSYGERDSSIPADSVRAFRNALRTPNDIVIYPTAAHAFFDHTRPSYVEAAATDSWRRALTFFTKYLQS